MYQPTNYEININGKIFYLRKYDDNKERFNETSQKWIKCCSSLDNCINYETHNGFFKKHQHLVIRNINIPFYFNIDMNHGSSKFFEVNNEIYRLSEENNKWQLTCHFINEDKDYNEKIRCVNFSKECGFCKRHKNGLDTGKNESTKIGYLNEQFIYSLFFMSAEFSNVINI